MSRINMISDDQATAEQGRLLAAIRQGLGMVPNFLRVFANSPVALEAFLGLHRIADAGELDPQTRERIALAVGQKNGCEYCVSAHTAIGRKAGLAGGEIRAARSGTSSDERAAAALTFVHQVLEHKGEITNSELLALKEAGYSEAEIVEIVTHIGMNVLTNLIGKISQVEIDFPHVDLRLAC